MIINISLQQAVKLYIIVVLQRNIQLGGSYRRHENDFKSIFFKICTCILYTQCY